jgi:hypothetical protein
MFVCFIIDSIESFREYLHPAPPWLHHELESLIQIDVLESNANLEHRMQKSSFEVISLAAESATAEGYNNHPIASINDHEVRISLAHPLMLTGLLT